MGGGGGRHRRKEDRGTLIFVTTRLRGREGGRGERGSKKTVKGSRPNTHDLTKFNNAIEIEHCIQFLSLSATLESSSINA